MKQGCHPRAQSRGAKQVVETHLVPKNGSYLQVGWCLRADQGRILEVATWEAIFKSGPTAEEDYFGRGILVGEDLGGGSSGRSVGLSGLGVPGPSGFGSSGVGSFGDGSFGFSPGGFSLGGVSSGGFSPGGFSLGG